MANKFATDEQLKAIGEALQAIAREDGAYDYPSKVAPTGYTNLRYAYKHADIHPSWLGTLLRRGAFEQYDENVDGVEVPGAIKNARGSWAVRIDALQLYDEGKREVGVGGGKGAVYKYEPQVIKSVKRAISAAKEAGLSEGTVAEMEALLEDLNGQWERGEIGKDKTEAETKEAEGEPEAEPAPAADAEDTDFGFDFEGLDK